MSESHLVAQDKRAEEIEATIPETEIGWTRVEKVLKGRTTNLDTAHTNPQLAFFLETVDRLARKPFPTTWEYASDVLAKTSPEDAYQDEAAHMLRYTMGFETAIPSTSNLPETDDFDSRASAIAELQCSARDNRHRT